MEKWLDDSLALDEYTCSNPIASLKNCDPQKVASFCKDTNGKGNFCPFLVPKRAFEGRDGEFVKVTSTQRRILPGQK